MDGRAIFKTVSSIGLVVAGLYLAYNLYRNGLDAGLLLRTAAILVCFLVGAVLLRKASKGGGTRSEL